jgi:hypothetical protein
VRGLSLKHYLREAFAAVTDIDSALIGTFRMLLTQPGRLSYEYLHGDRHRYLPPFRVFLLCNVVYFLFATQYGATIPSAGRSVVILATFSPVVTAFKFLLFLATLAWIGR